MWEVKVVVLEEDESGVITRTTKSEVYSANYVAIATGHHSKPNWPDFPGQETFTGGSIKSER